MLATNSAKAMKHIAGQLNDRDAIHLAAEKLVHVDLGELSRIDAYVAGIPLHTIPDSLVSLTMLLGSTVRQFKEKVEMALHIHRRMDADMFTDFFETLAAMNKSIADTCRDIEDAVKRLEG